MSRRITVVVAVAAALGLGVVVATGVAQAAPKRMAIVGKLVFAPGRFVMDTTHFTPRDFAIRSGRRVTVRNRTNEPHTVSLVRKSRLPRSFNCPVCSDISGAHGANEQTGEVANPVVDLGRPGFNRPGDSMFIPPRGRVTFRVTAPRGKTLHFLCAIHPWMQGRIRVR